MFRFPMRKEKIEEKLDQLIALTSDVKTDVSLLQQSHQQVKQDQSKVSEVVGNHAEQLAKMRVDLDRNSAYSSSHKKSIDSVISRVATLEDTQKARQPVWYVLAKIWDKIILLLAAGVAAHFGGILHF